MIFDPMRSRPFRGVVCTGGPSAPPGLVEAVRKEERERMEVFGTDAPADGYIVWNPQGATRPTVVHASRPEAIRAAGALAHKQPGSTFYVCKLVHRAKKPVIPDVTYQDLER